MAKQAELVSIVVPTLNRPKALRRALNSLVAQVVPKTVLIEILVVDNSPDLSASWVEQDYPGVRYISEPIPGVANARNAGVRYSNGRWVAFLDDDEEAAPQWIAHHVDILKLTRADASFGPVEACAEAPPAIASQTMFEIFERRLDVPSGSDIVGQVAFLGTNNSVFDRAACLSSSAPFDVSLNEFGGEDSLLLQQLVRQGRRFVWAANAKVVEYVPEKRLAWDYVTRRRFLSGQIRTFVQAGLTPPRWGHVAFWMLTGAVQGIVWSALAVLSREPEQAKYARSKAWGGWGKLFWGKRFRPRLYGAGLVS